MESISEWSLHCLGVYVRCRIPHPRVQPLERHSALDAVAGMMDKTVNILSPSISQSATSRPLYPEDLQRAISSRFSSTSNLRGRGLESNGRQTGSGLGGSVYSWQCDTTFWNAPYTYSPLQYGASSSYWACTKRVRLGGPPPLRWWACSYSTSNYSCGCPR